MCSLFSDEAVCVDFATLGDSVDSSDQIFPSHIRRHRLQADHGIDGFISGSCKLELANRAEIQFQIHPSASHMGVLHFLQCCSNRNYFDCNSHSWWPTATLKCGLFPGWTNMFETSSTDRQGLLAVPWLFLFDGRCCQPWCLSCGEPLVVTLVYKPYCLYRYIMIYHDISTINHT